MNRIHVATGIGEWTGMASWIAQCYWVTIPNGFITTEQWYWDYAVIDFSICNNNPGLTFGYSRSAHNSNASFYNNSENWNFA
jgi:hypothetical protein